MKKLLNININYIKFLNDIKDINIIKTALILKQEKINSIKITFKKNYKINKKKIIILKKIIKTNFNFNIKISDEILNFIIKIKPKYCCLIPENKIVIDNDLNIIKYINKISLLTNLLNNNGIKVSVFINPDLNQIDAAINAGCNSIELNTKIYSLSTNSLEKKYNFNKIKKAAYYANKKGLIVNVVCGINYDNIKKISKIKEINEININYSIINSSIIIGLKKAIKNILLLIN
ncbi:MAG: pyridoxine 5'-phosphate synthase [Enterobacteriaceae bacterium PSpyr]|nr:MAG: pyridoxine 5'-phosphate synthase [Enterobacteriaceae bacterium PSpyr]